MTMIPSALLVTIATHPFQIMLAVAVVVYAARASLSALSERAQSRPIRTVELRPAA
jgi:hypothetical protein